MGADFVQLSGEDGTQIGFLAQGGVGLIITGHASVETAVEGLKKGAYDYLTKPLDFDELRKTALFPFPADGRSWGVWQRCVRLGEQRRFAAQPLHDIGMDSCIKCCKKMTRL